MSDLPRGGARERGCVGASALRHPCSLAPLLVIAVILLASCAPLATPTPAARREVIEAGIAEVVFNEPALVLDKRAEPYRRVKLSDDLEVSGADDQTLSLLDLQSGDVVRVEGKSVGRDFVAERVTVVQTAERTAPTATAPRPNLTATPTPTVFSNDPAPFSGMILIADSGNHRVIEVSAEKKIVWEFPPRTGAPPSAFAFPSRVSLAPNGKSLLIVHAGNHQVVEIDNASRRVLWSFGEAGVAGPDDKHLNAPNDALRLRDGRTVIADTRNCRILIVSADKKSVAQIGKTGDCSGERGSLGKLNGVAWLTNGNLLITDSASARVSEIDLKGNVARVLSLPNIANPSAAVATSAGNVLVASYANPGRIVEIDWNGQIVWEFASAANERLDRPSRALELPNGNIAFSDDYNHRVVVVNRAGKVLWQYGVTGVAGKASGYLSVPEGIDFRAVAAPTLMPTFTPTR